MAFTPTVTTQNTVFKIPVGGVYWCFGTVTFAGADTYVVGGFDIQQQIRKLFGVSDILFWACNGPSGDGAGAQTNIGSGMLARWTGYPQTSSSATGKIVIYSIGRKNNSTNNASEVELAAGDSVNACVFNFWAICSGEGRSSDQNT